ncbi:DUF1850 domain-containing protein [Sporosarcina sp. Marseille-Q4063]|uniref:DUF1850 domain-containing protein n=1 Tax=Sporosarcina sp. Marseille-Q4063 TaxID=2810514 RepID=UPI001BAF23C6|nr:DUF1850 domain-containing protein [Sporosarcina sp. Marseille-Q4063]QUW21276.1 DUF1850 domain-containing protein [Sporosarcina sp. Marseille-Q4063]
MKRRRLVTPAGLKVGKIAIPCIIFLLLVCHSLNSVYVFSISCCTDELVYSEVVNGNEELSIEYEHSLYKVKQKEYFELRNTEFELHSMFFGNYQAYDYYDSNSYGELQQNDDGTYLLTNLTYKLNQINFRNAAFSNLLVTINDTSINLGELVETGEIIQMKINKKARILTYLGGKQDGER